jgi:capsular polysaccharide biosynthesis protein
MDETIDLRPYVAALIRHVWLLGLAVLLAVIFSIALFMMGDDYVATALVTVPEPAQQVQFDPRITTNIQSTQLLTAYPRLALSDDLLARLLPRANELSGGTVHNLTTLNDALEVTSSTDVRLVSLSAKLPEPQAAADLANAWAEEFIATVDKVYGRNGADFFIDQVSQAGAELQSAEDALVAFQTTNRQTTVDNEFGALTQLQMAYLLRQNAYRMALDDIQTLQVQLQGQGTDAVTLADQLSALTVQLQTYQTISPTQTLPAFQLNIGPDALLTTTQRAEQLQRLEALRASIESGLVTVDTQLATIEPQLFALQTEKQRLFNEGERLIRQRDIAQETYATLSRKVDEERVAAEETMARLASSAAAPEQPDRPNIILLLPLLTFAALLLAAGAIILLTWWRQVNASTA